MKLAGCFVAIVTPFHQDRIDERAMSEHAKWLMEKGVSGIVVCGTTGESATLSNREKLQAISIVRDAMDGRGTLIAGAGNNSTSESLEFMEYLRREGGAVDAVMSVVPYYNKPTQDGLIGHFTAIADAAHAPVVLYNVPARTVTSMTVETMGLLARHANVAAIKEASANLFLDALLRDAVGENASLLSGDDATALPFMAIGGNGVISVIGNIAPELMVELCRAAQNGEVERARDLNSKVAELQSLLFAVSNPIPVKAACSHLGFGNGDVRLPLARVSAESERALFARLDELGIRR